MLEPKMNNLVPYVVSQTGTGERQYDIYSRLLEDRIIFLDGEIRDANADLVVAQIIYLESVDPKKPINLYINSPGGSVSAGLAIYDTMQYVSCPVNTICIGMCASMASIILSGGTKGGRSILPHARVMIHQPLGKLSGQTSDVLISAKEIQRVKEATSKILAENCGKSIDEIYHAIQRDCYLSAEEAVAFGIVDTIVEKK